MMKHNTPTMNIMIQTGEMQITTEHRHINTPRAIIMFMRYVVCILYNLAVFKILFQRKSKRIYKLFSWNNILFINPIKHID